MPRWSFLGLLAGYKAMCRVVRSCGVCRVSRAIDKSQIGDRFTAAVSPQADVAQNDNAERASV